MGGLDAVAIALLLHSGSIEATRRAIEPYAREVSARLSEREDWPSTWRALDQLKSLAKGSQRFQIEWSALDLRGKASESDARKRSDRATTLRARILRAELALVAGTPARPIADPHTDIEFLPGEAWLAARHLATCPLRLRAFREALDEVRGEVRAARCEALNAALRDDVVNVRIEGAEALARLACELSANAQTTTDLAIVLRLRGEADAADALLERALSERGDSAGRAMTMTERGRLQRGLGHSDAAARWLGAALAEGSDEAALCLARAALYESESSRARTLYRSLIDRGAAPEEAWRGWGLSLLTAEHLRRPTSLENPGNP